MKNTYSSFLASFRTLALGLLVAGVQACSSSDSGGNGGSISFADPMDSSTLRSALITGSSADNDAEYWECVVADGSATLEYRLMSDGTGVENDRANPTVTSGFTWQTNTATSASIFVTASGVQNELSDINFTDSEHMSLVVAQTLELSCARQGGQTVVPDASAAPAGSNALAYGGVGYGLTHGFERVYSGYRNGGRSHDQHNICIADASFELHYNTSIGLGGGGVSWYPNDETVSFCASLFVPVDTRLETASSNFVSDDVDEQNNAQFAGQYFANDGEFEIDLNSNGEISSDENEKFDVISGTISFTRVSDDIANMRFDVVLDDGSTVSGSFEGQFIFYDDSV
ncbi:hypothetical protein [Granulosicoccus antarcticus]|uniref:Transferrin-binding protein B C-lobe/N-lobe beta barrel domain-containing protein n=1 Tax=Granulosicoccus antarcticus IMCC3135 TaxID=1192854 RepID=A0A2Z2P2R3_9GAMM|nr:hypothetical protein [Granulosicoccus antarcticus]ASJ76628.1 hypothetical protein IMCC3135_32920 [Granulosicoccus antarcticus IMCC3135]